MSGISISWTTGTSAYVTYIHTYIHTYIYIYIYMSFSKQVQLYVRLNVSKRALRLCSTKPNNEPIHDGLQKQVRPTSQFQYSLPQVLAGLSELPPVPLQQARGTFQELALSISLTILRLTVTPMACNCPDCTRSCAAAIFSFSKSCRGIRTTKNI